MKILGKVLLLLVVGLVVAGVGYPLLHEGGHVLAALMVGGGVEEVRLLPTASVLCRMPTSHHGIAAVGMSGLLFPCAVAAVLPHRRFFGWYVRFILLSVCLIINGATVAAALSGRRMPQDDLAQVLHYAPTTAVHCYGTLVAVLAIGALLWWRAKPLTHWRGFLCPQETMYK